MKTRTRNALHMLAGSGFSDNELYDFLNELKSRPPGYWMEILMLIREDMRHAKYRLYYEEIAPRNRNSIRGNQDSVGARVEILLKDEAGLTTAKAVAQLTQRLVDAGLVEKKMVPPLSRKALRDWVDRLERLISAKEILRHATLLRNVYANGPDADWKLG